MSQIIVVGHKNPDNDSIASAIAYAHLKNCIDPSNTYVPARLGPLPKETVWVLERFGVPVPVAIPHVRNRARDAMTAPVVCIQPDTSMLEVARTLRQEQVSALAVVDGDEHFCGIITLRDVADFYIDQVDGLFDVLPEEGEAHDDVVAEASARLLAFERFSCPAANYIDAGVDTCGPDDLLADVSLFVLAPPYREAIVLDNEHHCLGIITRGDIARTTKRNVILVDHNEMMQAATGIEEARVCEIVDHHRVGDIQTSSPILFLNLPLGSTATIVAQQYETQGVAIPRDMAAVLLSAIMTDTLLLKSPTATQIDRDIAARLAAIIGMDAVEFGMEVFKSRKGDKLAKAADIIGADAKEFRIGDHLVVVAQHETADLAAMLERYDELMSAMTEKVAVRGYSTLLLMLTDVVAEGSQFLCAGDVHPIERAFGVTFAEGGVWMSGVLSRKKQVASRLIEHGA